jgi:hypothetical protein
MLSESEQESDVSGEKLLMFSKSDQPGDIQHKRSADALEIGTSSFLSCVGRTSMLSKSERPVAILHGPDVYAFKIGRSG